MRKLISIVLLITCILSLGLTGNAQASNAETSDNTIRLLNVLEIMQGDENGNFNGDDPLTREQFAKIVIAIVEPEFVSSSNVSPYSDVKYYDWSAGYIERASELEYFHGFPDGSFRPYEYVTTEQICKIMLKLLGYENEQSSSNWAAAQVAAAKSKGILDNVSYETGASVTRINVAKIIENTLLTPKKDSTAYLITDLGYIYFEDAIIVSDKNVSAGYVSTSAGNLKKGSNFSADYIGRKGDIIANKKNEIIYFRSVSQNSESYIVKSIAGNQITVFNRTGAITNIEDETICYVSGEQMSYKNARDSLSMGDKIIVFKDEYGNVDYISVTGNAMSDPGFKSSFSVSDNTQIIKDGVQSTLSEIDSLDICYYIADVDTLLAYSKRVTGVFENATPTKENIKYITVSGNEYEIGDQKAFNKLSSAGNIQYGDTVTLLFGKDNTVADVVTLDDKATITGYLIDCSMSERTTEKGNKVYEYVAQVLTPDGNINSYSAEKDYANYEGKVVKVSFKSGKAAITTVKTDNSISGTFSWTKKTLGKYTLSADIHIIDVMEVDYENTMGKGVKVFPQRIDKASLSSTNILYANIEDGEITELILNDYTGDIYEYGILLKAENQSSDYMMQGTYEINVNGSINKYVTTNKLFSVSTGSVVAFDAVGTEPVLMKKINSYSGKVTAVDETYAYIGNSKYRLSDDVVIYKQVSNTASGTGLRYEIIEKEAIDFEKNITAYYNKAEDKGGRIRVIVVKI